jgi:DNA repair ATPase RecN
MIIKRFSATKVLNTNAPGFIKGRKYDTDLDRLSRGETTRELHEELEKLNLEKERKEALKKAKKELKETGNLGREIQKSKSELNNGRTGKWLSTD